MIANYKHLELINFPIFGLPSDDVYMSDGLLMYEGLVIDDRNQLGETVGTRRLQSPHKLLKINKHYADLSMLLSAKNQRVFIDNIGYFFVYERTKFTKIVYHKILKVIERGVATVLKVQGVSFPIIVKRPPPKGRHYLGVLYLNNRPWLPYDYSVEHCASKRKKI